ncbi:MAG: carbon starvation protein A [Bacteroidales bacterium]|nr:carbon starvation protein A [Bacteroidales bacterium]
MNTLILTIFAAIGYIVAYRLYGKFLAGKIFRSDDQKEMPSHEFNDGVDFVPAKPHIVFGHHFTTIAGLGPIVGPAIGIIWGWLPAFLWVVFGAIFMGAVHDFSVLVISARNKGRTIGDLTGSIINPSTRIAFQFIIQFLLLIVLSLFTIIVATLFVKYPESVFPVWFQIPIAVWLGWQIRKGKNDFIYSVIAVLLLYISIVIGVKIPIRIFPLLGSEVITWSFIIFIYAFFASTVPVHKLLQPRDYINSHQLIIAIVLLVVGITVVHPVINVPALNPAATREGTDIPGLMPLLFITIACGAISGFHSLASSGTTVKQIDREKDMLPVGYGAMLLESFLAVVVIMIVAGGLGMGLKTSSGILYGLDAYNYQYSSWSGINAGIGNKISAFVTGAANLLSQIGIPEKFAASLIAVFIVSFANTTLDSSTRIQRFSMQEIFTRKDGKTNMVTENRYIATFLVVLPAVLLTLNELLSKGGLELWRLFGALNQLLAALGLGIVSVYLFHKKKNYMVAFIPMLFVLMFTVWAMIDNVFEFYSGNKPILLALAVLVLVFTIWMLIGGILSLFDKSKNKA